MFRNGRFWDNRKWHLWAKYDYSRKLWFWSWTGPESAGYPSRGFRDGQIAVSELQKILASSNYCTASNMCVVNTDTRNQPSYC